MKLLFESWQKYLQEGVGAFETEFQLFIPKACPDQKCDPAKLNSVSPVENIRYMNKPAGGVWTSTAFEKDGKWTSSWNDWMSYNMTTWMHPQGILLRPKTDNVFHVESDDDARQLYEMFPLESEDDFMGTRLVDYTKAIQEYDAIHWGKKTGKGSDAWEFGSKGAWDVESTVWRDMSVLEVIKTVDVPFDKHIDMEW